MLFVSNAYAQDAAAAAPSGLESFIPIILIFVVFYFLLIRPQSKRLKEHDAMVKALKRHDKVVTGGGILGKVTKVNEQGNTIEVEISSGVTIEVIRSTVSEVITPETKGANNNGTKKASTKKQKAK